ncbi:MAG: hypothetical protein WBD16_05265 [Pyrinomonadaceae bacterium]
MHNIALKISTFFLTCGLGVLVSIFINGSASRWSQYFAFDDLNETRSCQVKLVTRDGQTIWMSCGQWVKHEQFELENSH